MVRCQKCGHDNDNDATYCEICGTNIKTTFSRGVPKPQLKKEGMSQSTKILVVVCVILVVGLGISAGALMQMYKGGNVVASNSSVTQSPTQLSNQKTWHEIDSFSGSTDVTENFNIKGNMFKIVMIANPQLNYNTNTMAINVLDSNNNLITSGDIGWAPTEAVSQKEKTIQITRTPGTYSLAVSTNALQNWTVNIYDYY
jgi:hypothetical protein